MRKKEDIRQSIVIIIVNKGLSLPIEFIVNLPVTFIAFPQLRVCYVAWCVIWVSLVWSISWISRILTSSEITPTMLSPSDLCRRRSPSSDLSDMVKHRSFSPQSIYEWILSWESFNMQTHKTKAPSKREREKKNFRKDGNWHLCNPNTVPFNHLCEFDQGIMSELRHWQWERARRLDWKK